MSSEVKTERGHEEVVGVHMLMPVYLPILPSTSLNALRFRFLGSEAVLLAPCHRKTLPVECSEEGVPC